MGKKLDEKTKILIKGIYNMFPTEVNQKENKMSRFYESLQVIMDQRQRQNENQSSGNKSWGPENEDINRCPSLNDMMLASNSISDIMSAAQR